MAYMAIVRCVDVLMMLCSREIRADMTVGGGVLSKGGLGQVKRQVKRLCVDSKSKDEDG